MQDCPDCADLIVPKTAIYTRNIKHARYNCSFHTSEQATEKDKAFYISHAFLLSTSNYACQRHFHGGHFTDNKFHDFSIQMYNENKKLSAPIKTPI
jgi:hypothetical protein